MNTLPLLIISIVVFLFGLAVGAFFGGAGRKKTRQPLPPAPPNEPLAVEGDLKILSAWRNKMNQVWLEIDGQRLENRQTMQPGQYNRLLGLVLDLRPWLDTDRTAAQPGPATAASMEPSPAASAAVVAARPVLPPAPAMNVPVAAQPVPAPAVDGIIQQINHVLQDKLATSPFKGRGIVLMEGPGGIVIVRDGTNKYEGVDAIPDPAIKDLIQQAVTEWEKSTK